MQCLNIRSAVSVLDSQKVWKQTTAFETTALLHGIFETILSLVPENGNHSNVKKQTKNHDKEIICKNHRANLLSSLSLIFYSETHGQLLNNEMLVLEGKHPRTCLCSEPLDMLFSLPGMFWITFSTWQTSKELLDEVALAQKRPRFKSQLPYLSLYGFICQMGI